MDKKKLAELLTFVKEVKVSIIQDRPDVFVGHLRSITVAFMENLDLKPEIKEIVPVKYLGDLYTAVRYIHSNMSHFTKGHYPKFQRKVITIEEILEETLKTLEIQTDAIIVFYSWQDDLPNSCNRGLIGRALEKAAKRIDSTGKKVIVDSDTRNLPGSPDIIHAILKKVEKATVFLADVSIVTTNEGVGFPNSNVMVELGYALKTLGDRQILMVLNEHYGSAKALPFDLGFKRQILYTCSPDVAEKSVPRTDLENKIHTAINAIVANLA